VQRAPQSTELTHSEERVFLPGRKNPVVLKRNSTALFLLQRVRDEAHRFAITYHRQLRTKERLRSVLDSIPGVGPTRRRRLLRHFGSVQRIRNASVDELAAVPGISATLAAQIQDALHAEEPRAADRGEAVPANEPDAEADEHPAAALPPKPAT